MRDFLQDVERAWQAITLSFERVAPKIPQSAMAGPPFVAVKMLALSSKV